MVRARIFRSRTAIAIVSTAVVITSAGWSTLAYYRQQSGDVSAQQRAAFKAGGLRQAASVKGSYRVKQPVHAVGVPRSLKEFVSLADEVVIGKVEGNNSQLELGGKSINMLFQIAVEDGLQGNRKTGDKLTMMLPGGRVYFPDGTWAEVVVPDYLYPATGDRVALVLMRTNGRADASQDSGANALVYVPVCEQLGIYNLSGRINPTFVVPSGNFRTYLADGIARQRLSVPMFIQVLRDAIPRQ